MASRAVTKLPKTGHYYHAGVDSKGRWLWKEADEEYFAECAERKRRILADEHLAKEAPAKKTRKRKA